MKQILAIVIYLFVLSHNAFAQNDVFKQMSSVNTSSPNVASLMKYVEFPISTFNGLSNVSLPLYEIKSGDISVPITLSYHSGGIKTPEESSWVGLGWSLSSGGVISHDIRGLDDQYGNYGYFEQFFPRPTLGQYRADQTNIKLIGCTPWDKNGNFWNKQTFYNLVSNTTLDGEADLYMYNFGNYSGKYINNGSNKIFDINRNNIQFFNYLDSAVAITPEGYKYSFGAFETSWTGSTVNARTAYYLTQITSPKGNKVIFKYKQFKDIYNLTPTQWEGSPTFLWNDPNCVAQLSSVSEQYSFTTWHESDCDSGTEIALNQTISSTFTSTLYLDRIEFDNGYVEFKQSPRQDMYGVKLDKINVHYKDGTPFKSYSFTYGYFIGQSIVDFYNNPQIKLSGTKITYPENYRKKRLKLLSVEQESKHSFEYYEGTPDLTLPYKSSFSQDYWGYNNGGENITLIPDFRRYTMQAEIPTVFSQWKGANREPHSEKIKAGILKKITYPTKGTSEFEYQIHNYTNITNQQGIEYSPQIISITDIGTGKKEMTFIISQDTYADINGTLLCSSGGNTSECGNGTQMTSWACGCLSSVSCSSTTDPANILYAQIEKLNPVSNAYSVYQDLIWDFSKEEIRKCTSGSAGNFSRSNYLLSPGTYKVIVNYPDDKTGEFGSKMSTITVQYSAPTTVRNTSNTGGGLRVSKVRYYDPESTRTMEKTYEYTNGIMMRFPVFYIRNWKTFLKLIPTVPSEPPRPCAYTKFTYTLYSSSIVPYSFSANGSLVGYQTVTEKYSDGKVGKIEYQYNATPDNYAYDTESFLPGIPSTPYLDNGFVTKMATFDKTNKLVKEVLNTPSIESAQTFWSFVKDVKAQEGTTPDWYCGFLYTYYYPIQIGKLMTKSTVERDYTNATTYIEKSKTYEYNPQVYLKSETSTNSDGTVVSREIKYPGDYSASSGWIKEMKDRNMISYPLETFTKRDNYVINGSFVKYKAHNNIITPNEVYQIETASPKVIASSAPSATLPVDFNLDGTIEYDRSGNIISTQSKNDVPTSYLWAHNNSYPVAVVKNAPLNATVAAQSFVSATRSIANTKQYPAFIVFPTAVSFALSYAQPINFRAQLNQATATTKVPFFALSIKDSKGKTWFTKQYIPGAVAGNDLVNLPADTYTLVYSFENYTPGTNPGLSCIIDVFQVHQQIFYTSFEEDNAAFVNEGKTGGKSHTGTIVFPLPAQIGKYVMTYWTKGGALTFSTSPTRTITGTTQNGWTYYECYFDNLSASILLTITTGTAKVDELRLYPQGAQMTSYTYDVLAGMTSATDAANVTTYYEYDTFRRLWYVKDQDGNIIKNYLYHYKGQ